LRSTATRRATSSELRLKLSPVTEQPMGDDQAADPAGG
jgi:hypothetical protein